MTSATPDASRESFFSGCVVLERRRSTRIGATALTDAPSSTRNDDSRSPQLWTSSSPKEGTSPDFSASTFVFSMSEMKSSASLPIVISNTFSPKGESPTAVCVSLWTSTPTKSVCERCIVCIDFNTVNLFSAVRRNSRHTRAEIPVCESHVLLAESDQSAICSLLLHRGEAEQSPMGFFPKNRDDRVWVSNAASLLYTLPENKTPSRDFSHTGVWGEAFRLARAEAKPRRSARKLGGRTRAEISLSFFEFFSGGARKRKIVRENFCKVAAVALAEAGGGAGHCPSKKVRAKDIISPNCRFSQGKSRCLAARTAPLG